MSDVDIVRRGLTEDGTHAPTTDGRHRLISVCRFDGEKWPCSTVVALGRLQAERDRLEEALEQIANGDVPWADGMQRAGSKDAHDLQAFARDVIEGAASE